MFKKNQNKYSFLGVFLIGIVLLSVLGIEGCKKKDDDVVVPPSLPTIVSISPTSGPVGTQVTITGTNFSATATENSVSFNGVSAQVSSANTTSIIVTVPVDATTGPVTITVNGNTVAGPEFTVTIPDPDNEDVTITSIEPTSGPVGTEVTITGTNFGVMSGDNIVVFHNGVVAEVLSDSETSLLVKVPVGAETGPISVTVGDQTTSSSVDFTVIETETLTVTQINPESGSVGTEVTITGTGFSPVAGENTVVFNDGVPATVTTASPTELIVSVPSGAITGVISITVGDVTIESDNFTIIEPEPGVYTYTVSKVAGRSVTGTLIDGPAQTARFSQPFGLAIDNDGNIYIADRFNHNIRMLSSDLSTVSTFAGSTNINEPGGYEDGIGTAARFNEPTGLAFDANGILYVGVPQNKRVRKISASGEVSLLAGNGTGGVVDGQGDQAQFNNPFAVFVNSDDEIIVADFSGNTLRKVTKDGTVTTYAGATTAGTTDGNLTAARFDGPLYMTEDPDGNLFISDFNNHTIRKITPAGDVSTFAGSTQGASDGIGSAAQFNNPSGLASDIDGNIYVADRGNHTIRRISPEGDVTTIAGMAGESGTVNGNGSEARFNEPNGMVMDSAGNLYVSDRLSGNIRKITIQYTE